jgi:type IV secretion system protein TrbL
MAITPCDIPIVGLDCSIAGSVASSVGGSVLSDLAKAFVDGEVEILKLLATSFMDVKSPDVSSAGSTVVWLQSSLQYLVVAAAVLGIIVAAGRMIWSRRSQPVSEAFAGLLKLILVSGAGTAAVTLMTGASDAFGRWILTNSTKDPSASLSSLATLTTGAFTSPALVLVLAALAIFGAIIQVALIFVQGALIVLLVGIWPLSCAASIFSGPVWFRKVTAWLVAVILYRFAAAIVFATSFKMMTNSSTGTGAIDGVVLLLLGAVCLPVVMRLVVPAVAAAGGVGAAEVAGAAAGVAMGAVMIAGTAGAGAAAGASFGAGVQSAGLAPKASGPDGAATAGPDSSPPTKTSGRSAAAAQGVAKGVHQTTEKLADGAAAVGGEQ